MSVEISLLIGAIGCFVGLFGWLSGRDKKISDDSHWKGTVDENLKAIKDGVSGIGERMAKMEGAVASHDKQIAIHDTQIKEQGSQIKELKQKFEEQERVS